MMTARELAEKIITGLEHTPPQTAWDWLESLLSAALAEAKKQGDILLPIDKDSHLGQHLLNKARAEALEEAIQSLAGMVENDYLDVPWENVEAAIRRRAGEGK